MCRPKTWHARNVPVRLVSRSRFQSDSGKSSVGARWLNPAALTRISTFPNVWTEACSTFSNDPRSPTSQLMRSDLRPMDSISSAIPFTSSMRRALGTTSAPASASPRASVRPIPEVPPITTATLSSSCRGLYANRDLQFAAWRTLVEPVLQCWAQERGRAFIKIDGGVWMRAKNRSWRQGADRAL